MFHLHRKNVMAKFRTRLKQLMKEQNVSRMELVRESGMSYPTVMKWETDAMQSVDADLVFILAHRFGVAWYEFIYLVDDDDNAVHDDEPEAMPQ